MDDDFLQTVALAELFGVEIRNIAGEELLDCNQHNDLYISTVLLMRRSNRD